MSHPFTLHTLTNGLRVVIERMPEVRSAATGFLARTGSRDETPELAGASHFLEHMCFKGTQKRDWHEISVAFDRLGSIYNAFTSTDRTFYYGWVPAGRIEEQIELLADMIRPTLPPDQFDTEKQVILEEIAMAKDSIEHVAFDLLLERVFEGHALGWPVLGYDSTVGHLTRDQLHAYFEERYAANRTLLIVAGNVDPTRIIDAAERLCGAWQPSQNRAERTPPRIRGGTAKRVIERFKQQLIALCFPAPSAVDDMHETAQAAASILGGMNSRFYWNIVQAGLSPHASAHRFDLQDCGLMILSGQTDPDGVEKLVDAIRREARDICHNRVSDQEVQRVKNKRRTALTVEGESPYHRLTQIADDVDYRGDPRTLEARLAGVEAVTVDSVARLFERYPVNGEGCLISVGPRDWPPDGGDA